MLARLASDQWNLLAWQENLLATNYRTRFLLSPASNKQLPSLKSFPYQEYMKNQSKVLKLQEREKTPQNQQKLEAVGPSSYITNILWFPSHCHTFRIGSISCLSHCWLVSAKWPSLWWVWVGACCFAPFLPRGYSFLAGYSKSCSCQRRLRKTKWSHVGGLSCFCIHLYHIHGRPRHSSVV